MVAGAGPGSVFVVGSVNEDVVLRVPRRPEPGETLSATSVVRRPGGKGANQAVAAARQGAGVQLLARVGADPAGQRMLDALASAGVGTDLVTTDRDVATGSAYIVVTPDGENSIVLEAGANHRLGPADVELGAPALRQAAVLLVQLEVPLDTVVAALALAVGAGVRPVLTLAPVQPVPDRALLGLDPLLANQHEAGFLLGREAITVGEAEPVARDLLDRGPRSVVITLGADGAVVGTASGVHRLPVASLGGGAGDVVDTTGAGDALAGALAAALARGEPLLDSARAGLEAAGAVVRRVGAR
ncbi:MAG: ribokinase [Acidimicrobiales bacterium]